MERRKFTREFKLVGRGIGGGGLKNHFSMHLGGACYGGGQKTSKVLNFAARGAFRNGRFPIHLPCASR
jgi:hypothetical protein